MRRWAAVAAIAGFGLLGVAALFGAFILSDLLLAGHDSSTQTVARVALVIAWVFGYQYAFRWFLRRFVPGLLPRRGPLGPIIDDMERHLPRRYRYETREDYTVSPPHFTITVRGPANGDQLAVVQRAYYQAVLNAGGSLVRSPALETRSKRFSSRLDFG